MAKKKTDSALVSVFKNSYAKKPDSQMTIEEFIEGIRDGKWRKQIQTLRNKPEGSPAYKKCKAGLPAVTVSGNFKSRDNQVNITERLRAHSGYICLDIDAKDNPKMRTKDLVDKECLAQFVSCSGKGIKIIYRCTPTKDAAIHRRIYDAAIERLNKKKVVLKVDPMVKSLASLQYVTHDPETFYFPKTKLEIKPLAPVKIKKKKPSANLTADLAQINEYVDILGDKDITKNYEDWVTIGHGLSYTLGEAGRDVFHRICKNYADYSEEECDEKYDGFLEDNAKEPSRPKTIASVYQLILDTLPKTSIKQLAKKYNRGHAVGKGEEDSDEDGNSDLSGMVRYGLFLFKKLYDGDKLNDLAPAEINLNAFETLLRDKGFKRYDSDTFVHIVDNIVERVDDHDILRIVTKHIEDEGSYCFSYKDVEYNFSWEELAFLWRKIRALGTTFNQLATCLEHWHPDLLTDTATESFIPYRNGVVKVNSKGWVVMSYNTIGKQIWKERILPRDFKYEKKPGMFEDFFANVCGDGKNESLRRNSEKYKRNLWYFGYMLHTFKDDSVSRAWMLYDIKAGNNGRTGKTIIGKAVGHIRSVTTLDGKQIDFRNNRFALQKVNPWTEVVFIDDPKKGMSIIPLFNMITGETDAERKGMDPITLKLKYMFASNWIMEAGETSEAGRQFITQVDDFYVRYSKENKNTIRPIVDYHNKIFFTQWDAKDWNQFDSFCVRALHHHLGKQTPENVIIGNSQQVRFIQVYEQEMFHAMVNALDKCKRKIQDGSLVVVRSGMVDAYNEHINSMPFNNKPSPGKVIREFFKCVGVEDIVVTSIADKDSLTKMVYKLDKQYEELNLGSAKTPIKHGTKQKRKVAVNGKKVSQRGATGQNKKSKNVKKAKSKNGASRKR